MAAAVYFLCAATSMVCAALLFRHYLRGRQRLLWWSTCCFVCLGLTNILLFLDLVVLLQLDLSLTRTMVSLAAMLLLLYGLVRETT